MQNNKLLIVSLVFGLSLCLSVASVKAVNTNQANINEDQASVNENQAGLNEDQVGLNKDQAEINRNQASLNERQANINKDQANINEKQGSNNELNGAEHRSNVATFVQGLLDVANREKGGIGEQVKAVASEQNDSKVEVSEVIEKIKNRSSLKTFLIGTDYKNVGKLRSEMVKTGNQVERLKKLLDKTTGEESKTDLETQVQALEEVQQKINDFVNSNESKFSLFGWFVKLFNK
ncbi:MAG: hypothetical protein Q8O88_05075 [bacterium]|nr:hypothetical protein [bacterium]